MSSNSTSEQEAKGNEKSQRLHVQSAVVVRVVSRLFWAFLPGHFTCLNYKHFEQVNDF